MLVRHRRLAVAAVVTATVIAVPTVAVASWSDSPSARPASSPAAAAGSKSAVVAGKSAAASKSAAGSRLAVLAASAGISLDRLQAGLAAAKRAGGNTAGGIAAFAASTGVSRATAQRIVHAVFGSRVSESGSLPAAVRAFATRLGIGTGAAARAVKQILALSRNGAVDRASPAFAAIAHGLGVSPAQLAAAWDAVKTSVVGR